MKKNYLVNIAKQKKEVSTDSTKNYFEISKFLYGFFLPALLMGCNVFKKSAKTAFTNDFYTQKTGNTKQVVYIHLENDAVYVYPTKIYNKERIIDTTAIIQSYENEMNGNFNKSLTFDKYTFDIDFLTIPLKYRPPVSDVPPQLNANLNGSVYFGYRLDRYNMHYISNPLQKSMRDINHFGFSLGVFAGFGNTFMSPTNTNNVLQQEYDGLVWNKGIAGIFAVNNITLGLVCGFDNLLDKNNKIWIYEARPWFGLAFGLNLN